MSAENREAFAYRWARRALIAVGVIAVLGALALAVELATFLWSGPRFEPAKVETADRQRGFTIGDVTAIDGTRLVRINISEGEGSRGSYSYSRNDLRNVMVLDSASGRNWRLIPDNDRRIVSTSWLPAAATGPADSANLELPPMVDAATREPARREPPAAYFLFVVDRDDGAHDLIAGTIDGLHRGVPMTGIDGVDSSWMRDATRLAMVVRQRGQLFYRIVDMTTFRVIASQPMPIGR